MSEETKQEQPATPSPPSNTPPAPTVDVEALKAQVAEEARAIIAEKEASFKADSEALEANIRKKLARQLSGEPEQPEVDPVLKQLVSNPGETLKTVSDLTKQAIKDEMAAEAKQKADDEKAIKPFKEEYPELLEEHFDYVDALVGANLNKGMDRTEAIKAAGDAAIKKLGLKSISERRKEGTYIETAVPGIGGAGYGGQPAFNNVSSSEDFIAGMKARAAALRGKKR